MCNCSGLALGEFLVESLATSHADGVRLGSASPTDSDASPSCVVDGWCIQRMGDNATKRAITNNALASDIEQSE